MRRTILCLALVLAGLPAARADERIAVARGLIEKTVAKTLTDGFRQAAAGTLAKLSPELAEQARPEIDRTFVQERANLVDALSKEYAQKFSEDELRHISKIYDDPVYQRFQALNADPNSLVSGITKETVTKLMNLLALTSLTQKPGEASPAAQPPAAAKP
ncbi:hypothetical protein [uncultured Methylobacterium sp.]|jgi:hypothetical protein|uniref:hypothetical protein n=1 Tax=uncultured Methylobacterium sp. TaxID=157278 RepID=UPI00263A13EC|nr:hypothetical protein [uncultured Methylobacterium sp.]